MDPRLVAAAKSGDVDDLHRLIQEDLHLLDRVALAGAETPLHIASMCGHLPFVQEMLKLRRQFAYDLNQDGFTPLHLASANGNLSVVLELLKHDPTGFCTAEGRDKRLALHCAVVKGRVEIVKELVSASPGTVGMKTSRDETALHLAVKNNQLGAFQLLLEHVKDLEKKEQVLNEKDHQGNTILHLAASRKQYQVIHLLLVEDAIKSQVELNSTNCKGLTPLDVLVLFPSEAGDLEIHRTLVEAGAKVQDEAPFLDHHDHPPHNNNDNQAPKPNLSTTQAEIVSVDSNNVEDDDNNNNNNNNNQARQLDQSAASALSDAQNSLLMTALTLIATATYQAVLSPPSGLWQDNAPHAKPPHVAGKSVLATNDPRHFIYFVIGNTVGLHLSLSSILLLTTHYYALLFALYCVIAVTYSVAVRSITPGGNMLWSAVFPIQIVLSFSLLFLHPLLRRYISKRSARQNLNP